MSTEFSPSGARLDVFLSYPRAAAPRARGLYKFLRGAGLKVWFDEAVPAAAESWYALAQRGLSHTRYHLVLLTAEAPIAWQEAELDHGERMAALHPGLITQPLVCEGYEPGRLAERLAALTPFKLPDDRDGLDAALRALVRQIEGTEPPRRSPLALPVRSPGLRPYELSDGRCFFGRDREIAEGTARLGEHEEGAFRRWLRVEGPVGVGRTSLVRAGLVPAILRGAVRGAPASWRVAALTASDKPLDALGDALAEALKGLVTAAEVQAALAPEGGGLVDLISENLQADQGLILVVDDLDEAAPEGARLDALLADALGDFDQRLLLLTTAKGALGGLPKLSALAGRVGAVLELAGLSRGGLKDAIAGPPRLAGGPWPSELVFRLCADAERTPSAPGKLSWALSALAHDPDRTVDAYEAFGGVAEGLVRALDGELKAVSVEDQGRARSLLTALVQPGHGGSDRAITLSQDEALACAGEGPRAALLVTRLAEGRSRSEHALPTPLLAIYGEGESARVQLAHPALPLLWPTLAAWVDEDRALLERRLEAEARAFAEEALPQGARLAFLSGGDLEEERRTRYLSLLRSDTRRFIKAAQTEAERQLQAQEALTRQERQALEQRHQAERRRSGRRVLFLQLVVVALLAGAGAAVSFGLKSQQREEELLTQVQWMDAQRQRVTEQLRATEASHLEAEKRRLDAERARQASAREKRQADREGVKAEQSADDVLAFALEVAVEADDFFRRIRGADAEYSRRAYAETVLRRLKARLAEAENDRLRFLLARQHTLLGDLEVSRLALRLAQPHYEAAVSVLAKLAEDTGSPRDLVALAESRNRLAQFFMLGRGREVRPSLSSAAEAFAAAVSDWERLVALEPDVVSHQAALAETLTRQGLTLLDLKRPADAQTPLVRAVELTKALSERAPQDVELRLNLARRTGYVGDSELDLGHSERGAAVFRAALGLLEGVSASPEQAPTLLALRTKLRRKLSEAR